MVERVRHLANEPSDGLPREACVAVERDDITNAGRRDERPPSGRDECRIARAAQQPVQLVEVAAFAFPSNPLFLPIVPHPPAMEQEETVTPGCRSVAAIETGDTLGGSLEKGVISLGVLGRGVCPIREKREIKVAFRTCKVVDLQTFDLLFERGLRREQGRDGNHGAQIHRHAIAQFQARQDRRTKSARHDPVHDRDREIHRRDQSEERQETQRPAADPRLPQRDHRQKQNDRCDNEDFADINADADLRAVTNKPTPHRRSKPDRSLERGAPPGDQMITGIALTAADTVVLWVGLVHWVSRGDNGCPRNFQFRPR